MHDACRTPSAHSAEPLNKGDVDRSTRPADANPTEGQWTLHHLDPAAHLPDVPRPPAAGPARSRGLLEKIAGAPFPASFSDADALLAGTGRRAPTGAQTASLGARARRLPLVLG